MEMPRPPDTGGLGKWRAGQKIQNENPGLKDKCIQNGPAPRTRPMEMREELNGVIMVIPGPTLKSQISIFNRQNSVQYKLL